MRIANRLKNENIKQRDLTPEVGTRWYKSPEVFLGQKDYDFQSEMWSVGLIMSELM
jgi:serine/threonine protein kinase